MNVDRTEQRQRLRAQLRQRRRDIPPALRIAAAERLAKHLLSLPIAPRSGHVAGYWAMDGEIALHAWQIGLPPECTYCLPVIGDDGLAFAPWRPGNPLASNHYGIPEPAIDRAGLLRPEEMDLVVLPLVGFDANGARLGMGGGWYDRSFAFRQGECSLPWLVGAGFALQQLDLIDVAEWDVPLDAVCTELDARVFANPSGEHDSP